MTAEGKVDPKTKKILSEAKSLSNLISIHEEALELHRAMVEQQSAFLSELREVVALTRSSNALISEVRGVVNEALKATNYLGPGLISSVKKKVQESQLLSNNEDIERQTSYRSNRQENPNGEKNITKIQEVGQWRTGDPIRSEAQFFRFAKSLGYAPRAASEAAKERLGKILNEGPITAREYREAFKRRELNSKNSISYAIGVLWGIRKDNAPLKERVKQQIREVLPGDFERLQKEGKL